VDLTTFYTYVKDVLNVGARADNFVTPATRQAWMWLERNASFKYMELYEDSATLSAGGKSYQMTSRTKSLHFIRIPKDDGSYQYIEQADPRNFETPEDAIPTHFYWSGERTLRFNNTADEDYTLELHRIAFTNFDAYTGTETPWLLVVGEDLVLAQTLLHLAVPLKDPDLFASNRPFRDEALKTVLAADLEARASAENPEMLYG
jgi:hypothetical protein